MKKNKENHKKERYDFYRHYKKMFFSYDELYEILLAASILYDDESSSIDELDLLEFLESNQADEYESIDEKFCSLSDNRKMLLMRRLNKVIKSKEAYNNGLELDEDGDVFVDTNFNDIIDKYFDNFLVKVNRPYV